MIHTSPLGCQVRQEPLHANLRALGEMAGKRLHNDGGTVSRTSIDGAIIQMLIAYRSEFPALMEEITAHAIESYVALENAE